jgi:hypothetical protein
MILLKKGVFFSEIKDEREEIARRLKAAIKGRNAEELEKVFKTILFKISYLVHIPAERYYRSVIHSCTIFLGIDIRPEVSSGLGRRSDLDIVLPGWIYASIEVKYRALS